MIECPTPAQRELFGPTRRRVPRMMDLKNPILLGPVQNQEHHMNGVVARRNNFNEPILGFLAQCYAEFGRLTGRHYGFLTEYKTEDADTVFVSLGCAADNVEAACDYLREQRNAKVGSIHVNVIRPFPEAAVINALRGKKNVIILERTERASPATIRRARHPWRWAKPRDNFGGTGLTFEETLRLFRGATVGSRDFRPEHLGAYEFATGVSSVLMARRRRWRPTSSRVDHLYAVISKTPLPSPERPSRCASIPLAAGA
jgi:pyruvate-ferredoxin/flavodoxin oxidoreductase